MESIQQKYCPGCRRWLRRSEFYPSKLYPDGLLYRCKGCEREACRQYRLRNIERERAQDKEYRAAHRPERAVQARKWQKAHPEASREGARRYREAHPDQARAKDKRWRKNNPEKVAGQKRRARELRMAQPDIPDWELVLFWEYFKRRCLRCGTEDDILRDHVEPLGRGGPNVAENLQPLCRRCNSVKGLRDTDYRPSDKTEEFRVELERRRSGSA